MKQCRKCGEWQEPAGFHQNRTTSDGLNGECKICARSRLAASRAAFRNRSPEELAAARPESKKCFDCGDLRLADEFAVDIGRRDGLSGRCKACNSRHAEEWRAAYPERHQDMHRRYNAQNREAIRRYKLLSQFGITREQYDRLSDIQDGTCAICREPEQTRANNGHTLKELAVDHDHETGAIRGLLCARCNKALGGFRDNIDYLRRAAEYLTIDHQHDVFQVLHELDRAPTPS